VPPSAPARSRFAPRVLALGLAAVATALLIFGVGALAAGEQASGFFAAALISVGMGLPGFVGAKDPGEPSRREALLSVLALWLVVPAVGAVPYWVSGHMGWMDAAFESMSGFTTTGATVLTDFGAFSPTLFLWRAFTQWVGGIGIIVLFVAVFPQLAIAGRQLFLTETPGPSEDRFTPRLRSTARAVLTVYLALTFAAFIAYLLSGLSTFDALAHAWTTLSAGGFSPHPRSLEVFGAATQWVAIVFMTLAGANFALQYRALMGRPVVLLRDFEFRAYLLIAAVVSGGMAAILMAFDQPDSIRHALFQTMSIMTTTGYASVGFVQWPQQAQALLLVLMFVGGSAGSAAGGVKVARLLIVAKNFAREIRRTLHPRAVLPVTLGSRMVPEDVLRAVGAFLTLYVGLFAVVAGILGVAGHDFTTSFTASIATLGNIGPGLGEVGPMGSFASFPDLEKGLLIFSMYAGRLEVVTVFVLFTSEWWRAPRARRIPAASMRGESRRE